MTFIAILFWIIVFAAGASALYAALRDGRSVTPPRSHAEDADFLPPSLLR